MKKLLSTLLLTGTFAASAETAPKNIIMVVGDGMGPAYVTAYRNFKDDPKTPAVETTVFDRLLVGRASTYPHHHDGFVTDSAAAATALATGVKTYNGAIGVDIDKQPHLTVMEQAKQQGKATGIVVTSQINHATPASYLSHVESRRMYDDIADSYFDDRINGQFKADVMLGGGWKYFIRKDRDIAKAFVDAGYQYANSYEQLNQLEGDQILGLFADVGLPWTLDSKQPQRLRVMTQKAVETLEKDKDGFLMLIEGSQVDWAGHANDIAAAMGEMDDLASTLEYLEGYVASHPDTLVVVTADHSTGGLTVGANGKYEWHPEFLKNLKMSPETLTRTLLMNGFDTKLVNDSLGFELTGDEMAGLKTAHKTSLEVVSLPKPITKAQKKAKRALYDAIKQVIDVRTNTGWTTGGHTGVDVPVFAAGRGAEQFKGQIDNTDIAKKIFNLLNSSK